MILSHQCSWNGAVHANDCVGMKGNKFLLVELPCLPFLWFGTYDGSTTADWLFATLQLYVS